MLNNSSWTHVSSKSLGLSTPEESSSKMYNLSAKLRQIVEPLCCIIVAECIYEIQRDEIKHQVMAVLDKGIQSATAAKTTKRHRPKVVYGEGREIHLVIVLIGVPIFHWTTQSTGPQRESWSLIFSRYFELLYNVGNRVICSSLEKRLNRVMSVGLEIIFIGRGFFGMDPFGFEFLDFEAAFFP